MLQRHRITPEQIIGTGPKRRILKGDVINFLASPKKPEARPSVVPPPVSPVFIPPTPTTPISDKGLFEDIPNSNVRRVIAARLTESKTTIPHSYVTAECLIDELLRIRAELNAQAKVKTSVNDFIIRALALALRDVPEANAMWQDGVKLLKGVDISVAVATPKGLLTPVVRNADAKTVLTISEEVKSLAAKAREGKLKPEEYQGGTASVSNLGMFGIDEFSAVINPPQACILAVGQGKKVLLPPEDGILFEEVPEEEEAAQSEGEGVEHQEQGQESEEGQEEKQEEEEEEKGPKYRLRAKVATSMAVSLSCDSRVVSDELAAELLARFQHFIERPDNILL